MAPGSGEVQGVMGQKPRSANFVTGSAGKMAIVFQNDRLLPWRTAVGQCRAGARDDGPRKERAARTGDALAGKAGPEGARERLSARAVRRHAPARVDLLRAFATDAELLLCDEPFSALDEMTSMAAAQRVRQPRPGEPQDGRVHHPFDRRGVRYRRPDRGTETTGRDRAGSRHDGRRRSGGKGAHSGATIHRTLSV